MTDLVFDGIVGSARYVSDLIIGFSQPKPIQDALLTRCEAKTVGQVSGMLEVRERLIRCPHEGVMKLWDEQFKEFGVAQIE